MLHVRGMHFADHRPYQYEDRWVHIAAVPNVLNAPLEKVSANEWLVREVPFSRGEISLSASNAADGEAELLEITAGSAVFVIDRVTWMIDIPITFVRMCHPSGFRIVTAI